MKLITKTAIFSVGLVLLPMLINYLIIQRFIYFELEERFSSTLAAAAQGVRSGFERIEKDLLSRTKTQIVHKALELAARDRLRKITTFYLNEIKRDFGFDFLEITDPRGMVISRGGWELDDTYPLLRSRWPEVGEAYFDLEDESEVYYKVTLPMAQNDYLVGYITGGMRVDRNLLAHFSTLTDSELAFFVGDKFITGTTEPFSLPPELAFNPVDTERIHLKSIPLRNEEYDFLFTPIVQEGKVYGWIGTGIPRSLVLKSLYKIRRNILKVTLFVLILGIVAAGYLVYSIKRSLFGLEPGEMARIFKQREAILQSAHEGIIAVDHQGRISLVNSQAQKLLGALGSLAGKHISEVLPNNAWLMEVLQTGKPVFDVQVMVGNTYVLGTALPISKEEKQVDGAVATFRDRTEFIKLAEELTEVRSYAQALRAQTHEFMNKLQTISGLVQLQRYDQALKVAHEATERQQDLISFLARAFPHSSLSGILLGKYNRAQELGITLEIDPRSKLPPLPAGFREADLICIIGNLIENSFEAVGGNAGSKKVAVSILHSDHKLTFRVQDNGCGIPPDIQKCVFERGFTTKAQKNRGMGLYLVSQSAANLNGQITLHSRPGEGTVFTVEIPMPPTSVDIA